MPPPIASPLPQAQTRRPARASARLPIPAPALPVPPVPAWLRQALAAPQSSVTAMAISGADAAFMAGAALATLDTLVCQQQSWAGVWRQRLALGAAAISVRQAGRGEDEAALRDALLLTKAGDDVGPAGRMALAWRHLATRPVAQLLQQDAIETMLEAFGHVVDHGVTGELAAELAELAQAPTLIASLKGSFAAGARLGTPMGIGKSVCAFLADAMLAQKLGWKHAVPLLGGEVLAQPHGSKERHKGRHKTGAQGPMLDEADLLLAQARAVLRAIDLSAALGRRAQKLVAVVPKLRARGAPGVVARLLDEDALVVARGVQMPGISERGLRRLFERLIALEALRELSGRPTFRIYGL